jgi:predicted kinase
MRQRIGMRQADASDASAEVLYRQLQADPGALDWRHIDASGGPGATFANARRALGLQ